MTSLLAKRLAFAYVSGDAVTPTASELALLRGWIDGGFERITAPVTFQDSDLDLPQTAALFAADGILRISTAYNWHPWLTPAQNARFRAVHDWHHLEIGADSTLAGERATFEHARLSAPGEIAWMLFSEIVLQAAVAIVTGSFADQKLVRVWGIH